MAAPSLTLNFAGTTSIELVETCFAVESATHRCIRGKTGGAYPKFGSFQWTSAVRALGVVVLRYLASSQCGIDTVVSGGQGSLASSLDFALCKSPNWLIEMFGCYHDGRTYGRRLFLLTNSNRKRPGFVGVSLNSNFLLAERIKITLNGVLVDSDSEIRALLEALETGSNRSERWDALGLEDKRGRRAA